MISADQSNNGAFFLHSVLLGKEMPLHVFYPQNYENSSGKFPVLYLLHGLFGRFDNWLNYTQIAEYAKDCSFLVVCVEGGDNWYSDNSQIENHFYESYIMDELIPAVEENFKVEKTKNKRMLAGLSMGGYGAFKFAFRRPEMFGFAAAMSGAFHAAEIFAGDDWTELHDSIVTIFGSDNDLRADNNLFQIVEDFPAERIGELPFFYFDCGAEDAFLPVNIRLAEIFQKRGIKHEFKICSGGHDWNYWNTQLKTILEKSQTRIKQAF